MVSGDRHRRRERFVANGLPAARHFPLAPHLPVGERSAAAPLYRRDSSPPTPPPSDIC